MIKQRFKEYFNYTKKERNGIIVLLIILMVLIGVNTYIKNKDYGEVVVYSEEFEKEIADFEASLELKEKEEKEFKQRKIKRKRKKKTWKKVDELFDFDPNRVNKTKLRKLGFTETQVKAIINYRESGGLFLAKEDLLKIYTLGEEQYQYLESYIKIENVRAEVDNTSNIEFKYFIDLNSAESDDLVKLKGIGESYANRILKYRALLGGFSNENQLLEIYGMDSVRLSNISESVFIDTSLIKKMNINKVQFKTLLRHPYLNKYQTQSIMKYREISGKFSSIEQLTEYNLIDIETFEKLKSYITVIDTLKN